MEFDFRDLAAAALAQNRLDAAGLLDWRQRVIAATGARERDVSFIVPPDVLPGVTEVGGSRVIHSADVDRPGVILPVLRAWRLRCWYPAAVTPGLSLSRAGTGQSSQLGHARAFNSCVSTCTPLPFGL